MLGKAMTSAGVLAGFIVLLANGAARGSSAIQGPPAARGGNSACVEACYSQAEERADACIAASCNGVCKEDSEACDACANRCVSSVKSRFVECMRRCGP